MKRTKELINWIFKPPYYGVPWLVWFYAAFACCCFNHGGVFAGVLTGYDDHVRMLQVLNWVNGADWYDRTITRVNAPEGFQTLWTRLVDIPFAAVILFCQNFMNQRQAALVAALIAPLMELAVLFVIAPYFARPLVGKKHARLIILFLMFTSVMNYKPFSMSGFHSGEVSHHAWYVILVLLLFGAAARIAGGVSSPAPPRFMGMAIGLLLAVGIEGFPLIAGAVLILSVLATCFNRPRMAAQTAQAMIWATLLSLILLPLHQPPAKWFSISFAEPSLLGPILTAAAAIFFAAQNFILRYFDRQKLYSIIATIFAGGVISAALIFVFPQMLDGPAAALSPAERALAFKEHAEAWPLYKAAADRIDFIGLLAPSLIALGASLYAVIQTKSPRRRALYLSYLGFTLISGSMAEVIARYYHHAMTVACAWLLWAWQKIKSRLVRNGSYSLKSTAIFIALGPFWMLLLPALNSDAPFLSQVLLYPAKVQTLPDYCNNVAFGQFLNQHYSKNTLLMVPGSDSSRMLFYSDLRIDFLNNYPSQNKFIDNQTFFGTQSMDAAKDIAKRHQFDLVAICKPLTDLPPLKPGEAPMLYERLQKNQPPDWLQPVNTRLYGYHLYQVRKDLL